MNPKALLLFTFSVNCVALVVSILFLLVGPLELRWIFAVWSVTSSMLLYFIAKTYRDIRRRQMINRWILSEESRHCRVLSYPAFLLMRGARRLKCVGNEARRWEVRLCAHKIVPERRGKGIVNLASA